MALNADYVGRTYHADDVYEVSRTKIVEFAEAIGDANPCYRDRTAAAGLGYPDVVAPPTFPIVVTRQAAGQVMFDPGLGLDYSRVVHGEQRFSYSRPVCAGDRLTVTATIESARTMAGNDIVTIRYDLATEDGEDVCSTRTMLVARAAESDG